MNGSKRARVKMRKMRRREEKWSIADAEARVDQELEDAEAVINAAISALNARLNTVESALL